MADALIFGANIKFDKTGGVTDKEINNVLSHIQTLISKNKLWVKLGIDPSSQVFLRNFGKDADIIEKKMKLIAKSIQDLQKSGKYWDGSGMTAHAQKLQQTYHELSVLRQTSSLKANEFEKMIVNSLKEEAKERERATKAAERQAEAERKAYLRRIDASRKMSLEYGKQSTYLQRLIQRMAVYASIGAIGAFLTKIREVTAEFELQRISLGAIIQDQQRANQLFAEIKAFALKSPLKILDLTKYTKQLAAYKIGTEDLFDTMKRLADVSVGLGVGMDRLILAYGQIRAAGVLRASEVRQLTEAGIPIVEELAKKLTDANGELVRSADVMDMISKRMISFQMVKEVFEDMTNAGGMFYNMQEKQGNTLYGMWQKLGDAVAVMYDQIGRTQSVNNAMKSTINLLRNLMLHWKDLATVVGSLTAAFATYKIVAVNTAVATKALTFAEASRLAITKAQVIQTPRLVAAMIGQNTATKLSTILTKAHTAAMLKQAMATNLVSRAFWGLSAAMLANPWALALAAVVAAGVAIWQFSTRVETAAEKADKLRASVVSLTDLENSTAPLIETYNELINKTERTAEEEKKLSAVTHELAKQYPGAITAIGNFGTEVELAGNKLNKLYETERNARMDKVKRDLESTENQINKTEKAIAQLQNRLNKGTKTETKTTFMGQTYEVEVQMSDTDKDKLLKQIDTLRYGEDGQGGLVALKEAAEEARRALKGITKEAQEIDEYGSWKKTLQGFKTEVGNIKVKLFQDIEIEQFGNLEEALKQTAKQYKENIALVKTYEDALAKSTLTAQEKADFETQKAKADAAANLAKQALEYYNALGLLTETGRGSGSQSDQRLQLLNNIASTMEKINKEYNDLLKKEGETQALADTQRLFAEEFANLQRIATRYKFKLPAFEVPKNASEVKQWYKAVADEIRRLQLKDADKILIELGYKEGKVDIAELQKQIERKLKDLQDRISASKTAKEFYDKILSATGDVDIAANVTMSIYGDTGEGLFEQTIAQIREVFKSGVEGVDIPIDLAFDLENQRIDYGKLAQIYEQYQNQIIEANRDTAQKIISEGQKTAAQNILNWEKELAKAKDYEQQRTDIIKQETQRRADIIKSNLPQEEKDQLIQQSKAQQSQKIADINFEEFKESEDYIRIFENLDNVSTDTLKRLRENLQQVIDTNKDLSPKNMKTLVKALEDIDNQISGRGFGNVMIQSVKDYISALNELKLAKAELATAQSEYDEELPQLDADIDVAKQAEIDAQNQLIEAQATLNGLKQSQLATEEQIISAQNQVVTAELRLNQATSNVALAEERKAKASEKVKKAEEKVNKAQDKQTKSSKKFFKDMEQVAQSANQLASILGDVKDLLGISADSAAGVAFDSAIEGLERFSKIMNTIIALQTLYNIVTSSNPWLAIASAVLAVASFLGSWISNSKVRKANKEIKRQQQILEQLEYTYSRLQKAQEKLFGSDYIQNYNQQLKNLAAQAEAYRKQAEAEKSKGKKADEDKIKDYENSWRDTIDDIKDMQGELASKFLGSSREDAAREFAQSWIEAKSTFADTADAIKSKYKDMIQSMVIEGAAAKVIDNILAPMWKAFDKTLGEGNVTQAIEDLINGMDTFTSQADKAMNVLYQSLLAKGYDLQQILGENTTDLTGISRDIATASEESINGLAQGINTQNYYISHVPTISENVAAIRILMEGGAVAQVGGDYNTLQNEHLAQLPIIAANTLATAERCERAAVACEEMANNIRRVVETKGNKFALRTTLN